MDGCGFEVCRICEKMRYGGVPILNIVLNFPEYEFLREIAEASFEWAKTTLFDKICCEYECDPDPKKRFCFGYDYEFSCKTKFCANGLLSAVISATLKKRKSREPFAENKFGIAIRKSDGAILPIEAVADKKTVKKYRKNGGKSFYLCDGGIVILSGGGEERLPVKNIVDFGDF